MPFYQLFLEEGSPTKIDYREKNTLILASLLEDLVDIPEYVITSGAKNCGPGP